MTGPLVRNRPLRYVARFLVLLSTIGTGVDLSYVVPVGVPYHEGLTW